MFIFTENSGISRGAVISISIAIATLLLTLILAGLILYYMRLRRISPSQPRLALSSAGENLQIAPAFPSLFVSG